jgi:P pilus assembly chaperone PapD
MNRSALAGVLSLVISAPASAVEQTPAIAISKSIIDFVPGSHRFDDIVVFNVGGVVAYVAVTGEEVVSPGLPSESRRELGERDTDIIVSPRKIVLPPGTQKSVRILLRTSNRTKERIFRFAVTPALADRNAEPQNSMVQVVIAYGLLVIVRPDPMTPKLVATRIGKTISFTNIGNTNVQLEDGKQCQGTAANQVCQDVAGVRLYAGETWSEELPFSGPVELSYSAGDKFFTEVFGR